MKERTRKRNNSKQINKKKRERTNGFRGCGGGGGGGGGGTCNRKLKIVTLKIALSDRSSNIVLCRSLQNLLKYSVLFCYTVSFPHSCNIPPGLEQLPTFNYLITGDNEFPLFMNTGTSPAK